MSNNSVSMTLKTTAQKYIFDLHSVYIQLTHSSALKKFVFIEEWKRAVYAIESKYTLHTLSLYSVDTLFRENNMIESLMYQYADACETAA